MLNSDTVADAEIASPCEYIEKEVDLAFYKDYCDPGKDGSASILNASCQRISHCHCNCNKCTMFQG